MNRKWKIAGAVAGSLVTLSLIVVLAALVAVRSGWFRDYVRRKIVSSVENSTGGLAALSAFAFDPRSMTATVTGFVLHGTEPPGSAPLFEAPRIVLTLRWFHLEYLGVERPRVNVIALAGGGTNIPSPKHPSTSGKPGLETFVNLAIRRLQIERGTLHFLDQTMPLDVRGRDFLLRLDYQPGSEHYRGRLSFAQVVAASPGRPPLDVNIDVPLDLGSDAIQIAQAKITTRASSIAANLSIEHMARPNISAQAVAHVALDELTRSVDLPIHPQPGLNAIDATLAIRDMQIQNALVSIGKTYIAASGDLRTGAQFEAGIAIDEIAALADLKRHPSGSVQIAGTAKIPLALNGTLKSNNLSYEQFRGMRIESAFHADPRTIELSGFTAGALGGEVRANARLANQSQFSVNGTLRNFSIANLSAALTKKTISYAGNIGGSIQASGDLKQTIRASAHLTIAPGGRGVPVSGRIDAGYDNGIVQLKPSSIVLPHTRIDLSGRIGEQADVRIESRSLEDFSPVANPGSAVRLRGGSGLVTIHESGPLSNPQLTGNVTLTNFMLEERRFDRLSAGLRASPSSAEISDGTLEHAGLRAQFSGSAGLSNWKLADQAPIRAKLTTSGGDAADFLALAGQPARITGPVTANMAIAGTAANPQGSAQVAAGPGNAYGEPFDRLQLAADLSDQRVDLTSLELTAGAARVEAHGTFLHPRDSFRTGRVQLHAGTDQIQLAQFKTLQQKRPGLSGIVELRADVLGELRSGAFVPSAVNANVSASEVRDQNRTYGSLALDATTYGSDLNTRLRSDFAGARVEATARTQLRSGYPTTADATIRNLALEKLNEFPARGVLSAEAHYSGTLDDPHADLRFHLANGSLYDQPITLADGSASYTNQLANLASLRVATPAGSLDVNGSFAHAASDFKTGKVDLHFHAPRVLLERVAYLQKARPGFAGVAILQADLSGDLRESQFLPANAEIKGTLQDLRIDTKPVGSANFEAHTASGALAMTLDAELAGSRVHGAGQAQLHGDYLGNANLTFSNLRYSSIQSLLAADAPFEALAEGQANFSGSFLQPREGTGSLQISRLEFSGTRPDLAAVALRNDGPIAARLDHSTIVIQQAKLTGTSTSINLAGSVGLNRGGPLDVRVDANADLSVAKTFNPDAFASGTVTANANVRGTFSDPQVTGRIDLKDASLQLADWPNGISNANGSILLNGTSARVNAISAQTGGGKLTIDGIAGFTGAAFDFNLRASAEQVRTRYAGASVTANASLTLTGNSQRSSLNGSATITRVGYSQQSDLGAILTQATAPPSAPAVPGLASRVRLNMRVRTAPGARFQTDLAEQLSATVDLNVLGTLQNPGMAGRITVNSGTLIFFGNKYTVNRGTILFFSATAIQPVLDIDLETSAQGVDINLSVSGPIDNLKLSYRSDPPLKFDDIVALLATGRTPPDPTIAVNQPYSPDLSATQMGESAILGQAIANPIANRLQRVFGVTQLKISPTFVAGSALPQARISLQEQVSAAVTLTYSQDLNQANSQLIRIELELTPRFSAVATRDENGIFGVDFYYKKQFR